MNAIRAKRWIIAAIFLSATAAISYEILAGAALSQLLGSSVFYFSLTIGVYLFALGTGSWFSKNIEEHIFEKFIAIELALSALGGALMAVIFSGFIATQRFVLAFAPYRHVDDLAMKLRIGEIAFNAFAFGFIFLIGFLVGFELPLFSRIVNRLEIAKDALARVFFWDYFGALAASFLVPVFLFPYLGIFRTAFFVGGINLLAVLALRRAARHFDAGVFQRRFALRCGFILVAVLNLLGFAYSPEIGSALEQRLYGGEAFYYKDSPYQRIVYVKDGEGIRLYLNGAGQFKSGRWDYAYHESLVHPALSLSKKREHILVLGGGDGLALREILKYPEVASVTLVDIDPVVVHAARTLPEVRALNGGSFDDPRVSVVHEDAFQFVRRSSSFFDAVIVDFPDPADENLSRLYSVEFYSNLQRLLGEGGLIAVQSSGYLSDTQQIAMATLRASGLHVKSYHPPFKQIDPLDFEYDLGFTLAGKNEFSAAIPFSISVPTRILTATTSAYLFANWNRSYREGDAVANTILKPVIFNLQGDVYVNLVFGTFNIKKYIDPLFFNSFREEVRARLEEA